MNIVRIRWQEPRIEFHVGTRLAISWPDEPGTVPNQELFNGGCLVTQGGALVAQTKVCQ